MLDFDRISPRQTRASNDPSECVCIDIEGRREGGE